MKNLLIRAASGSVYVGLIVASVLCFEWSQWPLAIVVAALMLVGLDEAHRLLSGTRPPVPVRVVDASAALALLYSSAALGDGMVLPVFVCYVVVRLVLQLFILSEGAIIGLQRSFTAMTYVTLPLLLVFPIAVRGGRFLLLAMFVLIWVNDTGAYLVGSTLGRHRMFERVSPKKSWEGFAGGLLFVLAAALLMRHFGWWPLLNCIEWLLLGAIVCLAATLGDLVESLLKRTAGVKDAGSVIPGHGGVLDRIDSVLLVAPVLYLIVTAIV